MLERLEGADLAAELLAHPRVLDRHLEGALRAAEAVGRDADRGEVEKARQHRPSLARVAEKRAIRQRDVLQHHLAEAAAEIDVTVRLHADAPHAPIDEEEGHALGTGAGLRACRHQEDVRRLGFRDEELRAGQHPAVAFPGRPGLDARRLLLIALLHMGDRGERLASDEPREPCRALRGRAGTQQPGDHELGGEEGAGGSDAPQLLQHERQVESGEPQAALLLGHEQAHPAELGHLPVEIAWHAVVGLRRLPHQRGRAFACQELPRRPLQRLLLLGQAEIDHAAGRRSTTRPGRSRAPKVQAVEHGGQLAERAHRQRAPGAVPHRDELDARGPRRSQVAFGVADVHASGRRDAEAREAFQDHVGMRLRALDVEHADRRVETAPSPNRCTTPVTVLPRLVAMPSRQVGRSAVRTSNRPGIGSHQLVERLVVQVRATRRASARTRRDRRRTSRRSPASRRGSGRAPATPRPWAPDRAGHRMAS